MISNLLKTGHGLNINCHTYAVEWTPDYIKWYLDGQQKGSAFQDTEWIAQSEDMYLLINLAIGGWEDDPDNSTLWPSYYECDWVRVWQKTATGGSEEFANSGFESSYLSPWYAWNDASVVNSNQRSGNYCLRVGDSPASAEQKITVEPETTYTFSGYGKAPSGQEVLIGVKDYGGSQITSPIRSTDYSRGSVTFTTGADNSAATVFFYHDQGSGYCYGDDFRIEIETTDIIKGDLNDDGTINSTDYALLSRYILGIINSFPPEAGISPADLNNDSAINSVDYALMKRYILGIINGF